MSGLQRLPDPTFPWRPYPEVMESMDWYGAKSFGPCYGNFWALWVCRVFPHRWSLPLKVTEADTDWPRIVRRCERCGSQIHTTWDAVPPQRGRI